MDWREQLHKLENTEEFDIAIFFLQGIIEKDPKEMDPYLALIYLLADTIVEPHSWEFSFSLDKAKCDYYAFRKNKYKILAEKYFARSFFKFNNSAEYLFLVGHSMIACPWIFGLGDDYEYFTIKKAHELDLENPIYQENFYYNLYISDPQNSKLYTWAELILGPNSPLNTWKGKGRVWEYVITRVESLPRDVLKFKHDQNIRQTMP